MESNRIRDKCCFLGVSRKSSDEVAFGQCLKGCFLSRDKSQVSRFHVYWADASVGP